eukprot:TRINITY_DN552_c0_g1_i2.p1 TRINITY_DN552_c0_g1~~TRINITY_DN552_c0_g1_i2.p1  ORF type:complete len:184 (+),score=49.88 TRINITY_DN552_c0_g1_i2:388-939(+)
MKRLKVPPAVNQFNTTLDKNSTHTLFEFLNAHKPESKYQKKQRLLNAAASEGGEVEGTKPTVVKFGLKHVTALIEQRKAKLVVIAHDVDPLELVIWMPTLCVKMGIPYVIVKGKARLGQVVRQKTATCLAITDYKPDQEQTFNLLTGKAFNEVYPVRMKEEGGKQMGYKHYCREQRLKKLADE